MSVKTYICVICGAPDLTKPKSYAVPEKNGRACRTHEEAVSAFSKTEEKRLENSTVIKEPPRNKFARGEGSGPSYGSTFPKFRNPRSYCWCCDKDGVSFSYFAERMLVNMSKLEQENKHFNMFDPNSELTQAVRHELDGKVVVNAFTVGHEFPEWKIQQLVGKYRLAQRDMLIRASGLVILCTNCASEYGFKIESPPEMTLEMMTTLAVVIKPVIDDIAREERTAVRH